MSRARKDDGICTCADWGKKAVLCRLRRTSFASDPILLNAVYSGHIVYVKATPELLELFPLNHYTIHAWVKAMDDRLIIHGVIEDLKFPERRWVTMFEL